jgi:hypothetical protein
VGGHRRISEKIFQPGSRILLRLCRVVNGGSGNSARESTPQSLGVVGQYQRMSRAMYQVEFQPTRKILRAS